MSGGNGAHRAAGGSPSTTFEDESRPKSRWAKIRNLFQNKQLTYVKFV